MIRFKVDRLLLGLIFTNALYAFDFMVISIAMPTITKDLNGASLYALGFGIFVVSTLVSVIWAGKKIDHDGPYKSISIGFIICKSLDLM